MVEPSDIIIPAGIVTGGYFLLDNLLSSGKEEEMDQIKDELDRVVADIEEEENPDKISDEKVEAHAETYKSKAEQLNEKLADVCEAEYDLGEFEDDLSGEDVYTKSLGWKFQYKTMLEQELACVAGESELNRILRQFPPWAQTAGKIFAFGASVGLIAKLSSYFKGGGGLGGLPNVIDWVENGLIGDQSNSDEIKEPSPPSEIPYGEHGGTGDTSPQVEGSPRGAGEVLGLENELVVEIATYAGVSVASKIVLTREALETVADATGNSVDWLVDNPSKAIIMALVIVAAAALATADGPLPVGNAAAVSLLKTTSAALGVTLPSLAVAKSSSDSIEV